MDPKPEGQTLAQASFWVLMQWQLGFAKEPQWSIYLFEQWQDRQRLDIGLTLIFASQGCSKKTNNLTNAPCLVNRFA